MCFINSWICLNFRASTSLFIELYPTMWICIATRTTTSMPTLSRSTPSITRPPSRPQVAAKAEHCLQKSQNKPPINGHFFSTEIWPWPSILIGSVNKKRLRFPPVFIHTSTKILQTYRKNVFYKKWLVSSFWIQH